MSMDPQDTKAIEWPKVNLGGRSYVLRMSFSATCQMVAWGFGEHDAIPPAAWAAALAGNWVGGRWRSAAWPKWTDLTDVMSEDELLPMSRAVDDALKKAYPAATVQTETQPESETVKA